MIANNFQLVEKSNVCPATDYFIIWDSHAFMYIVYVEKHQTFQTCGDCV